MSVLIVLQGVQLPQFRTVVIILSAVIFFFLVLWLVPKWQLTPWKNKLNPEDYVDQQNSARATLAQILGGVFVLIGLYFTGQNLKNSQETLRVSEEGQITQRFTKAIEQLGTADDPAKKETNLAIRLGGIYALERIARDSEKDHWPIMQILTAFVREKSPWSAEGDIRDVTQIPKDVQSVMSVLGWRARTYMNGEGDKDRRLDLHGTDLRGLVLKGGAHLEGANLDGAQLEKALLRGIFLNDALLTNANLRNVDLFGAHLSGAVLTDADLEGTDLMSSDITPAQLASAINWERARNVPEDKRNAARALTTPK
jgi:hypothetical protein